MAVANILTDCCSIVGGSGELCLFSVNEGNPTCATAAECSAIECQSLCPVSTSECGTSSCVLNPSTNLSSCEQSLDTLLCDDFYPCTVDSCLGDGSCAHNPVDAFCDDGLSCTVDSCELASGCSFTPDDSACGIATVCQPRVCHPTLGCQSTLVASTRACVCSDGAQDFCLSADLSSIASAAISLNSPVPEVCVVLRTDANLVVTNVASFEVSVTVNGSVAARSLSSAQGTVCFTAPTQPGFLYVEAWVSGFPLSPRTIQVTPATVPTVGIISPIAASAFTSIGNITVAFQDAHGNVVPGNSASIQIGSLLRQNLSPFAGVFTLASYPSSSLAQGFYPITLQFAGEDVPASPANFQSLTATSTSPSESTFTVNPTAVVAGQNATLVVTLRASDRSPKLSCLDSVLYQIDDGPVVTLPQSDCSLGVYTKVIGFTQAGRVRLHVYLSSTTSPLAGSPASIQVVPAGVLNFITSTDFAAPQSCSLGSFSSCPSAESLFSISVTALDPFNNRVSDSVLMTIQEGAGNRTVVFDSDIPFKFQIIKDGTANISLRSSSNAAVGVVFARSIVLAPLPPPFVVEVRFSDDGSRVVAQFDDSIPTAMSQAIPGCVGLIDPPAGRTFGVGSYCAWLNPTTLRVFLGSGADLVPNDQVRIGSSASIIARANFNGLPFVAADFVVLPPFNPIQPVAVITAPRSVGVCSSFVVSGARSTGSAGRALSYTWTANTPIPGFTRSGTSNVLESSSLAAGSETQFSLIVRNWLGMTSASSSIFVLRQSVPSPVVSLEEVVTGTRREGAIVRGVVVLEPCLGTLNTSFTWSLSDSTLQNALPSSSLTKRDLVIGTNQLIGGSRFNVTFRAALVDNPAVFAEASAQVVVVSQALELEIVGGDVIKPSSTSLTLESSLVDPDSTVGAVTYSWSCVDESATNPCDLSGTMSTLSSLALPMNLESGATYLFSLNASKGSRSTLATVRVSVISGVAPQVQLTVPAKVLPPGPGQVATFVGIVAGGNGALTRTWSLILGVTSLDIAASGGQIIDDLQNNGTILVTTVRFPRGVTTLSPGAVFQVQLVGSFGGVPGSESVARRTVVVASPPVGGTFTSDVSSASVVSPVTVSSNPDLWMVDTADQIKTFSISTISSTAPPSQPPLTICSECDLGLDTTIYFGSPGNWTILLTVRDSFLAESTRSIEVSITPSSQSSQVILSLCGDLTARAANLAFAANVQGLYGAALTVGEFCANQDRRRQALSSTSLQSQSLKLMVVAEANSVHTSSSLTSAGLALSTTAVMANLTASNMQTASSLLQTLTSNRELLRNEDTGSALAMSANSLARSISANTSASSVQDVSQALNAVLQGQRQRLLCGESPFVRVLSEFIAGSGSVLNGGTVGPVTLPPLAASTSSGRDCLGVSVVASTFDWTDPSSLTTVARTGLSATSGSVVSLQVTDPSDSDSAIYTFDTAATLELTASQATWVNPGCEIRPETTAQWTLNSSSCAVTDLSLQSVKVNSGNVASLTVFSFSTGHVRIVELGACSSNNSRCSRFSCLVTGLCFTCSADAECADASTPYCSFGACVSTLPTPPTSGGASAGAGAEDESTALGAGPIVGIVLGSVAFVVCVILIVIFVRRQRSSTKEDDVEMTSSSVYSSTASGSESGSFSGPSESYSGSGSSESSEGRSSSSSSFSDSS